MKGPINAVNASFKEFRGGIPEPYFYVTAYPLPDAMADLSLPAGTTWQTEGFNGALLRYADLSKSANPKDYLISLWTQLLSAGRTHMLKTSN